MSIDILANSIKIFKKKNIKIQFHYETQIDTFH